MPTTTKISASEKSAYQRPYKTRSQRREIARRQHDENADSKFLIRVAVVVGVLLLVAIGVAIKSGLASDAPPVATEVLR